MSPTNLMRKVVSPRSIRLQSSAARRKPAGYTLIEVLIGVTLTLILLSVMIRAFTVAGDAISKGRAVMELSGELRSASETLRHDLRSATVRFLPWSATGTDEGYFEMFEGPTRDNSFIGATDATNNNAILNSYGDGDDMIMLTARNLDHPYQGLYNGTVVESKVAEIIWWTVLNDQNGDGQLNSNETITLHRRVLLVMPQLNNANGFLTSGVTIPAFLQFNDISVHVDANGNLVANTLADLSKRENRFGHYPTVAPFAVLPFTAFPYPLNRAYLNSLVLQDSRQGEDVVLSNIAAFDAKVFDPGAVIKGYPLPSGEGVAVTPEDPGYVAPAATAIGMGTYVDLNYFGNSNLSFFSGPPNAKSQLGQNVYCTWSSSYERDGIDQDGIAGPDQGTDGLDNDGAHGADDEAERETSPPYPYPLRGVQVTFRVRDPASQQIRQTSVESSFVPE